jgi:phage gpG-like protein
VDTGRLKNAITQKKISKLNYEIVAQTNYAAYVEFGTGGLVDIPQGLEAYAAQFKGKGIRKVNLPARPYLFPSFIEARAKLIEELKRVLKKPR